MLTTIDVHHDGTYGFAHVWQDGQGRRYEEESLDAIVRVILRCDPSIVSANLYRNGKMAGRVIWGAITA